VRKVISVVVAMVLGLPLGALAAEPVQNFDLQSADKTFQSPVQGGFRVGDQTRTVDVGDSVTAAELAALNQIVASGRQNLILSQTGVAVGGSLSIHNDLVSQLGNLSIPKGVTAFGDFSKGPSFVLSGDLVNGGKLFAFSQNPAANLASFQAQNITNVAGSLISTVMPAGILPGISPIAALDLHLNAKQDLINAGLIESSKGVSITAGGSIQNIGSTSNIQARTDVLLNSASGQVVNAGAIQALAGNVGISAASNADLNIQAQGGRFVAGQAINVREPGYSGATKTGLSGGDYISGALNIHAGVGDVEAVLGEVSGTLNADGANAHVLAHTPELRLGDICMVGDPTFYNIDAGGNGDINITGDITVGEKLAIVAAGNITNSGATGPISITARDGSGQGYDIVMVAGANITTPATGGDASLGGGALPAGTQITISDTGAPGGNIDLSSQFTIIDSSSTSGDLDGGDVTIVAFQNGTTGGDIDLSSAYIFGAPSGLGTGASVQIIGGHDSSTIEVGAVETHTVDQLPSGFAGVITSAPHFQSGNPTLTFNADGSVQGDDIIVPSLADGEFGTINLHDAVSSGSVIVNSGTGSVQNRGQLSALTLLSIVGSNVDVGADPDLHTMRSNTLLIASVPGASLTVSGAATSEGRFNVITSAAGPLSFETTDMRFDGQTVLSSSDQANGVWIKPASNVRGHAFIQVNSPTLTLEGNLEANAVTFNAAGAPFAGTIMNPSGDVNLSSNYTFSGQNLTILAAGNITAAPNVNSLKLSSTTGDGGNLALIAGFDFIDVATGLAPTPISIDTSRTFEITGGSAFGGGVLLPNVNIDVGTTSPAADAGSVTAVARSGLSNSGIIALGNINAKATATGIGGLIRLIGDDGVLTKSINNSAGQSNVVSLSALTPALVGGPVQVNKGTLTGSGTFAPGSASKSFSAAINVAGTITTTSSALRGGYVHLRADGPVTVQGLIKTAGAAEHGLTDTASGPVQISSLFGSVTTSTIDVTAVNKSAPASGGSIRILGTTGVLIKGNALANGSNAVTGDAGDGGFMTIETALEEEPVKITGYVKAVGGNAANGSGGRGGFVELSGNTVQVMGSSGGVSVSAGTGIGNFVFSGGIVRINTNDFQSLPTSFDLLSSTKSIPVRPGSVFTVGTANPINGVAGSIVASTNGGPITKSTLNSLGYLKAPASYNQSNVQINVAGTDQIDFTNPVISVEAINPATNKRNFITPSQAIAAFQMEHGETPIAFDSNGVATGGGTISISEVRILGPFTAFKLPSNYTLNVFGFAPVLKLPSSTLLAGDVNFPIPGTYLMDFGTASPNISATTEINATSGQLIIATNGATINNSGVINALALLLGRTSTSPVTFNNIGPAAEVNSSIVMSPTGMASLGANFRAKSSTFDSPVVALQLPLSTKFDALALSYAKGASKPINVNVTFALFDGANNAIPARIGGIYNAGTMNIKSVPVTSSGVAIKTPIVLSEDTLFGSRSTMNIISVGSLTTENSVVLLSDAALNIAADQVTIGDANVIKAGRLSSSAPLTGLVPTTSIVKTGALTITATGAGGITAGFQNQISAVGANVNITAKAGNAQLGENNIFEAAGGRLIVLAKGTISDVLGNIYMGRAIDKAGNTGGGVEFSSGVTTSTAISAAFGKPAGVVDGFNPTGIDLSGIDGVFWAKQSGGGAITFPGLPGLIDMEKGVIVVQAIGAGAGVTLNSPIIATAGLKPIADLSVESPSNEIIVDSGLDVVGFEE
jgi:hypothetical protein